MTINSMKLGTKLSVFAVTLIITSGLASASLAELNLFPETSSSRIDSFTSYQLEIENTGPVRDEYTLSSSNPSEITIAPREVELEPGKTETVNVWFNPAIDREEGTYSFEIKATSRATGDRFSETGKVEIIKEHDVSISVNRSSKKACLGNNAEYEVRVKNTGIQPEDFSLSSDFGKLSRKSLRLEDGETAVVTLAVSSKREVQRSFDIVAASKTSYAQDIQKVNFAAEKCYDSGISVTPKKQRTAALTQAEFKVSLSNTGTRTDTFTLSASKGELDDTRLKVEAGETRTTELSYTPQKTKRTRIKVTATGRSRSSQRVTVNGYNGMSSGVSFAESSRNICENERATYELKLNNTGEADETFRLSSNIGELEDTEVELEQGESEEVELEVNSSTGVGTHTVRVTSTATTFGKPSNASASKLVVENCYDLDMQVIPEVISAGENRSAIYRIELNNTGTRENTYKLTHEGPTWIDVRPKNVTVPAGKADSAYIYAGIPFQKKGRVKITARAVGTQVEESQTVQLLIGKEIKDAIQNGKNNVTGSFTQGLRRSLTGFTSSDNLAVLGASLVVAILVTIGILMKG